MNKPTHALFVKSCRAFSLMEVLGITAVLAALAVVSIISVKDTVAAGQRSAMQRELQVLNGALQNYKSAGGAIPETASLDDALAALTQGVNLSGSDYVALPKDPEREFTVGGELYELNYNPEDGFSYANDAGDAVGFAGGQLAGAGGSAFPFDITDDAARRAALDSVRDDPYSAAGLSNFEALKAAAELGYLAPAEIAELADIYAQSPSELAELLAVLDESSQINMVGQILGWSSSFLNIYHLGAPSEFQSNSWRGQPEVTSLHDVFSHLPAGGVGSILNNMRGAEELGGFTLDNLSGLNLTGWNTGAIPGVPHTDAEVTEVFLADMGTNSLLNVAISEGYSSVDELVSGWGFNSLAELTQEMHVWYGPKVLPQPALSFALFNLAGSNVSADQLNAAGSLFGANLSGVQTLAGFDTTGRDLQFVNFADSNISPAQLQAAGQITGVNLSRLNLLGMNTAGMSFLNVNLSGADISSAQLSAAQSLVGANLSNLDLTGLITNGKPLNGVNFYGSTISTDQLNAATDLRYANLSMQDLTGLQLAGRNMQNVNFAGSNITAAQLNAASNISGVNLSGLNTLGGLNLTGKSIAAMDFSNSNITGEQLNGANLGHWGDGANLSGVTNLSGFNTTGKDLSGTNFAGSGITAAQLNQSVDFRYANLSNLNLTGLDTTGRNLAVNFSGSSITITQLLGGASIAGAHLVDVNFTREELQSALGAAGKTGRGWDLNEVKW